MNAMLSSASLFAVVAAASLSAAPLDFTAFGSDALECSAFGESELTYEEARNEALRTGQPLLVAVVGSYQNVPAGAVRAYWLNEHGYEIGLHWFVPVNGRMVYAGRTKPTTTAYTYRQATSHTHTCPKHPDDPWDHLSNPGHQCQQCGTTVTIQDRSPRMIRTQAAPVIRAESFSSSGGCSSGNCSTSSGRVGFLRR